MEIVIATVVDSVKVKYSFQAREMASDGLVAIVVHSWRYAMLLEPDAGSARPLVGRGGITFNFPPPTAFTGSHD